MKINSIIDQCNDKGQYLLVKILGNNETEAITKIASSVEDITKLASDKFAWSDFRKFPINSQDNTILSKMYFEHQRENIPAEYRVKIAAKLDTYLDLYNVPDSIFEQKEKPIEKVAQEPRYLLPKIEMCKIASTEDLTQANNIFETEYKKLGISDRVEFAKNFMKCANEFKFKEVPKPMIVKYASMLDTNFSDVKNFLNIRVAAANRIGKSGKEYTKLAEALSGEEITGSKEELEKLAEIILELDTQYGFDHPKYDKLMPCAYGVVFNKTAMDLTNDDTLDEVGADKSSIVGRYGHGILEEVEKDDGTVDTEKLAKLTKKLNLNSVKTK